MKKVVSFLLCIAVLLVSTVQPVFAVDNSKKVEELSFLENEEFLKEAAITSEEKSIRFTRTKEIETRGTVKKYRTEIVQVFTENQAQRSALENLISIEGPGIISEVVNDNMNTVVGQVGVCYEVEERGTGMFANEYVSLTEVVAGVDAVSWQVQVTALSLGFRSYIDGRREDSWGDRVNTVDIENGVWYHDVEYHAALENEIGNYFEITYTIFVERGTGSWSFEIPLILSLPVA